jgi:hypothetical protein
MRCGSAPILTWPACMARVWCGTKASAAPTSTATVAIVLKMAIIVSAALLTLLNLWLKSVYFHDLFILLSTCCTLITLLCVSPPSRSAECLVPSRPVDA